MPGKDKIARGWSKNFSRGNAVYQINMLAKIMIDSFDARFTKETGLNIRSVRVLRLIGDYPGITFAEIVPAAALERSLVSRIIQHLVRRKYITRWNSDDDARQFKLYITQTGLKTRSRADTLSDLGLKSIFAPFEASEISNLTEIMGKLARWLDSDAYEHELARLLQSFPTNSDDTTDDDTPGSGAPDYNA